MSDKNLDYKKFEKELLLLSPHLSEQEAEEIIRKLFKFWESMIENIDLFKR